MSCSYRGSFNLLVLGLTIAVGCSDDPPEQKSTSVADQAPAAEPAEVFMSSSIRTQDQQTNQSLARLEPAARVSWTKVSRTESRSTAKVRVKNTSDRTIDTVRYYLVCLDEDGQFQKDSPDSGLVPHGAGGINLAKGESETFDIADMFLKDQVSAVEAFIYEIEYADGTKWPPIPSGLSGKESSDPVTIRMIGYVGSDSCSQAVLACANSSSKPLNSISWVIQYFDKNGKQLHSTSSGQGGNWSIEPGQGEVLTGGDGPPEQTGDVKVMIRRVVYADGSTWEPADKSRQL